MLQLRRSSPFSSLRPVIWSADWCVVCSWTVCDRDWCAVCSWTVCDRDWCAVCSGGVCDQYQTDGLRSAAAAAAAGPAWFISGERGGGGGQRGGSASSEAEEGLGGGGRTRRARLQRYSVLGIFRITYSVCTVLGSEAKEGCRANSLKL